ncbi:unnamed protein product [Anisakis simplex]|uniref:Ovule protein n=1 Tax=Anisakis simplex TaxID=6269 RepID=A0A0M3JDY0_ANISI|nr:unnamed protein product [Anisakis simplex]
MSEFTEKRDKVMGSKEQQGTTNSEYGHRLDLYETHQCITTNLKSNNSNGWSIFGWKIDGERWIFEWVKDLVGWNIPSGFDSSVQLIGNHWFEV